MVGTVVFHWFASNSGQMLGPWRPVEGRQNWTGEPPFWQRQIKDMMDANLDVIHVHKSRYMEPQRVNLFKALNQLRAQGYDVPKAAPFHDANCIWFNPDQGDYVDVATQAGKDEYVNEYVIWFNQYFSQNTDPDAVSCLAQIDGKAVLYSWGASPPKVLNIASLSRSDVESRLSAALGGTYPLFNSPVFMIFDTGNSPSWIDEKANMFAISQYLILTTYNSKRTGTLKGGVWTKNVYVPGDIMYRDGGYHFVDAWTSLLATMNSSPKIYHAFIESWNEYDEGTGMFAADPGPPYTIPPNTDTDVWSSTNNPREYIDTTATKSAPFNGLPARNAQFLWHNIPPSVDTGQPFNVSLIVRNTGNNKWSAANNYKLGLMGPTLTQYHFDHDAQGWTLLSNAFGTSGNTSYETGSWGASNGQTGGGLTTRTGNVNNTTYSSGASTAWATTFHLNNTTNLAIHFKWRLLVSASYASDEYGEARLEIDNQAYGQPGQVYLAHWAGGKGYDQDTGWQEFSQLVNLSGPGDHTIEIGGYNNKKNQSNEYVDTFIDDVKLILVDTLSGFGSSRFLLNDQEDEIPTYKGIFRGRPKTFNISLAAPSTAGTYDLNFLMLQESIAWFGSILSVTIQVLPAATNPAPADKATGISPSTALNWTAGAGATGHQVYWGTNETAVNNADTNSPEFVANLPPGTTTFDPPGRLQQNTTSFWRIDEVQSSGPAVKGVIWSFTTYRILGDLDNDDDVDQADFGLLQACYTSLMQPVAAGCEAADLDGSGSINLRDFDLFLACFGGPDQTPSCPEQAK